VIGAAIGSAVLGGVGYLLGQFFFRNHFLAKKPTSEGELVGRREDWPSLVTRRAMKASVDASNQKTEAKPEYGPGFIPDPYGGYHEEGGQSGLVKGREVAAAAIPGNYSDPSVSRQASVRSSVFVHDPGFDKIKVKWHVHPSGQKKTRDGVEVTDAPLSMPQAPGMKVSETKTSNFDQQPSGPDLQNAQNEKDLQKWVLGARSKEAYLYDETSTSSRPYVIKVPFEEFFRGVP
jgi:hypothetical protein